MYWDRFDICEAYFLAFTHCYGGQGCSLYSRLSRMTEYFTPSPLLTVENLTENGREIYEAACKRFMS